MASLPDPLIRGSGVGRSSLPRGTFGQAGPADGVGAPYRSAIEDGPVAPRAPFTVDPVMVDRANQAHAATQNALAAFLREKGIEPRSPAIDDPDADLLWQVAGTVYVAEVKSITESNAEKQLRLGLGQILRYRQLLAAARHRVVAVLVTEREPPKSWQALCDELGVVLTWPGAFDRVVGAPGAAP
jgi:hypothetical protein